MSPLPTRDARHRIGTIARAHYTSVVMRDTLALILGGGQGSRLFPLTQHRSKPAVPIGGKYRLIDVPISNCLHADLRRIFVLTQFNSASLNRHVAGAYRMDTFSNGFVEILAAEQTPDSTAWFQGTADAVRKAARHFAQYDADYYLILAGDHLYRMDYAQLLDAHVERHEGGAGGRAAADGREAFQVGLLFELLDGAVPVEGEDAHAGGVGGSHGKGGNRDVGVAVAVLVDQDGVIHAVEVIAGQDQVVVGVVAHEMPGRLPDRVGGALIPVGVVGRLLSREDLDEAVAERVHPVGLRDVPVERGGVELRQHEDAADVRVQAIADRDVDEAVAPADWHGRLRSVLGQGKQARALAAAEDDRQHFVVHRPDDSKPGARSVSAM